MRVKELIESLSKLDPELVVGVASDEEGNRFETWSGDISFAKYVPDDDYYEHDFTTSTYINDDEEAEVSEADATAIIIWP